jgi:hypothetical protein
LIRAVSNLAVLTGLAFAAAGCSAASKLLNDDPPPAQPQAYRDLSMPPDLQLRAPGTVAAPDIVQPQQQTELASAGLDTPDAGTATVTSQSPTAQTSPSAAAQVDVYQRYGISKVKPDGTPKSTAELGRELREAQLAEKRQKNQKYGTVFNIGNIFKDE